MWLYQTLGYVSPLSPQASRAKAQSSISPTVRVGSDGQVLGSLLGGGQWVPQRAQGFSFLPLLTDWDGEANLSSRPPTLFPRLFPSSSMVPAGVTQTPPGLVCPAHLASAARRAAWCYRQLLDEQMGERVLFHLDRKLSSPSFPIALWRLCSESGLKTLSIKPCHPFLPPCWI